MPSIYQSPRPRASPLWQLLTAAWDDFLSRYEKFHSSTLGPRRPNVIIAVCNFLRCGDLVFGFLRFTACPPKTSLPPSTSSATVSYTHCTKANTSAPTVSPISSPRNIPTPTSTTAAKKPSPTPKAANT
ncbi:MAG: hypothetical protein ACRCXD_00315 [Luteolibacter sp.]